MTGDDQRTATTEPSTLTRPGPADPVARYARRSARPLELRDPAHAEDERPHPDDVLVLVDRPVFPRPGRPRIVAAVRDLPAETAVLDEAADLARRIGAEVVVAHAVPVSFGEHSVGLVEALRHGDEVLEAGRRRIADRVPGLPVRTALARRWAHELLGEDLDADLVVLGGWRRGCRAGLGLVAHSAVHHAPCPVLLVPRG